VLVRLEAFERAAEIASEILETSREGTTRARARWVAAVAALASGDRDAALEHLRAAAGDDPAAAGARESARELETGSYRAERVALTAARMSCRGKKGDESTVGGILARGNFPDTATYFRALREAKADAAYDAHFEGFVRSECR